MTAIASDHEARHPSGWPDVLSTSSGSQTHRRAQGKAPPRMPTSTDPSPIGSPTDDSTGSSAPASSGPVPGLNGEAPPHPEQALPGTAGTRPGSSAPSPGTDAARTRRSAWAALVLLAGGPSVGIVLALVGGPWQVVTALHLGALAIWFLVWRRGWRDLLRSAGPRSPWLLFAVSAGLCALSAVVHHSIDNPGAVLAPVTPAGLLSALATALGVGVLMNAVPEEFSLRRCLLEPLRAQFGGGFALWTTALAFVVMHLPTWISSHATASTYAAEVPAKLLFGLVAAWSVLRLDSLAFALGIARGWQLHRCSAELSEPGGDPDRMEPVHHSVRHRHARRDGRDGRSRLVPGTPAPSNRRRPRAYGGTMSTSTDDADAPATATPPPAPVESRMEGRTRTGAEEAPCTALLTASLERSRERFDRALNGVTVEQANTQPAPRTAPRVDSLSWLVWHTAREIDLQVSTLTGTEALWTAGGFKERFALPLPDDTEDWHHTPEQAALVRVDDLTVLTDYLDAAYALIRGYLAGLTTASLDDVVDRAWDPPVTRASRLASIIDDAAQHSGQAVYSHRLLGLEG